MVWDIGLSTGAAVMIGEKKTASEDKRDTGLERRDKQRRQH